MEGDSSSSKKRAPYDDYGFTDFIFSWSIEDILNEELYKNQVQKIELSFQSIDHYLGSYKYPLLEETRAQLCSNMDMIYQAPFAEVIGLEEAKPFGKKLYNFKIDSWKNRFTHPGEPYKILPGDVLVLADYKPETARDMQRFGRTWSFVSVVKTTEDENDDNMSVYFKVKTSKDIDTSKLRKESLFLVFLTNISPNRRIWSGLHMSGNLKLVKQILCTEFKENCNYSSEGDAVWDDCSYRWLSSELNESQYKAICACLSGIHCNHNSTVKLIWGPPGTGKTKTLGTLLFALLKMKYRILVCAPTNVAIKEVAARVLSIVRELHCRESDDLFCSTGDMLLFGNNERLKIGEDVEDIYLDCRVQELTKCFSPSNNGWSSCIESMIDLLKNCVFNYHIFIENEMIREKTINRKSSDCSQRKLKSFIEFVRERFLLIALPLKSCISILCTHVAMCMLEHNFQNLVCLNKALDSFQDSLFEKCLLSEGLEKHFSDLKISENSSWSDNAAHQVYQKRNECLSALIRVKDSLGRLKLKKSFNKDSIREFCFQTSSLIFCTTSGSYKLHSVAMKPLNILVIDEAAQLKECESIIPMLLPGISHSILVGDECQLPSMVRSNVSYEAGFGRSLFERLSSLDHPKHLLNMQHRMHPEISLFPNSFFYFNKIQDAPNVQGNNHRKQYLPQPMFCPYSFINVIGGREQFDDAGRSYKNMAEVAVVITILKNLYKAWLTSKEKEKLCIGIVSPYNGQVVAIQQKLGKMYESHDGFKVNVKSIDGFQGGEQDVVILSTVRTNNRTSLEFIASPQRTNVALTRARHCLWILGNERALTSNDNVWKAVVLDAMNRKCFFNADQDMELAKAIMDAKREMDQFDDLLDTNSVLFRNAMWKVHFSGKFLRSFKRLRSEQSKNMVINLLQRLSSGWRPKRTSTELSCENSSHILKQFKVESRYVICSIDIVKVSRYIQVLKVWDILPLEDIPKLVKRLDSVFGRYTDEYISLCKEKCFDRNIEFPLSWPVSANIQKFKNVNNANKGDLNAFEDKCFAENSKFEESMLLIKYCSFHDGLVVDLPFELTDEERDIILFPQSAFVLGRSGTGKTTVLTTKLIQNEKLHHLAVEAAYGSNSYANPDKQSKEIAAETERPVLRQLFVTLSPGLCLEVKHHVSRLKRSLCEGSSIDEDIGDSLIQFKDIQDSFFDLPSDLYPLVITFRKFLLMLDGTLSNSYFKRFCDPKKNSSYSQNHGLSSVELETIIMRKEVNYERFDSLYWPHFNSQFSKKLDSYQVFTETMSHIKGGIRAVKLSREDYYTSCESRTSSLSMKTREMIYDIFQNYEKMKMQNGEFDLTDIVIDLHSRLRTERYRGDEMNFVYIDEVQDLTMAQIALFKHVCRNVKEGFVFCGDTAQTIGRGIDFRFQDVRSLFYKNFVLESKTWGHDKRKEKAHISDIFLLSQNFRTCAEVLKLSQSVIELLFHFFPYSVDMLKVENSLIHGEAPVVLESKNRENPIVTIFGESGWKGGSNCEFGAEQVILVRDDSSRKEIMQYVGNQALVLTILECKGLEFQDLMLYNFFASSPLKRRWGVIYEYMKGKHLLDSRAHRSFDDSKHNVLCSELKQLYVALTRARKRLWICEDAEEFSRPMFDYWKKKNLVQCKNLDASLAEKMKEASTTEEWKSRGMKLYFQNNHDMATVCFERAGDSEWVKISKAAGPRVTANITC
ncbi:uncharacterized protein LOC133298681 [Gastrolobium bilobum]|uniref:uncharacterized protein LOC133298681 n=1 Tax=Gastrolobium bilobum TaxID=150636 RepID=UPI002AB04A27|nr:uncharacterized protein LOC133298681 [Gastrolobium bilobum]